VLDDLEITLTSSREAMREAPGVTTPGRLWHLWLVGILGGLWSTIGAVSFILTQMNVEAVMGRFPPEQRAYFASFPWWADGCWALGVFGGVIGCLLLLFRSRLAVPVLFVSFVGATVSNLGGVFFLGGLEVMRETGGLGFSAVPIAIGAFLSYYARAMSRRGVLTG
jgi:hypothetical protein